MALSKSRQIGYLAAIAILGFSLGFPVNYVFFNGQSSIHTLTLKWPLQLLEPGECVAGYVDKWTTSRSIMILQVDTWLGKPYNILWEGDIFLMTCNDVDPWHPDVDEVLIHYQFDSHAASSQPHFRSFNLRPGFTMEKDMTLYVYRLFNSFDVKPSNCGDGWVRLYYQHV